MAFEINQFYALFCVTTKEFCFFYITSLSVPQAIQRCMIGWSVNDWLERIWKKAAVPTGGTEKNSKTSI